MQYMPGWTVQCLNPECMERGHWLRAQDAPQEICRSCGAPLHNVPPPLAPKPSFHTTSGVILLPAWSARTVRKS